MSFPSAPSTPETASSQASPVLRRAFTLPAKIASNKLHSVASTADGDGIETLFTHTYAKIVSFTTASDAPRPASAHARRPSVPLDADTAQSIPWTSVTERTLAAGPVRIYRVTASNISFLNSGRLLHTIFPKSQCWCVDAESTFVLRIRQESYYRIELPYASDEDKTKAEDFKLALGKVLQYEKTACPFDRSFEVDLPEQPKTPVRRRISKPAEKAKKWLFDKNWVPEDGSKPPTDVSDSAVSSSFEDDDKDLVQMTDTKKESSKTQMPQLDSKAAIPAMKKLDSKPPSVSVAQRARAFTISRSITAPPQVIFGPPSPLNLKKVGHLQVPEPVTEQVEHADDAISRISSVDSFYSLARSQSRSETPPFEDAASTFEAKPWARHEDGASHSGQAGDEPEWRRGRHRRRTSELTVTARSRAHSEERLPSTPTDGGGTKSAPSTPPLMSDSDDSFEPPMLDVLTPPDTIRLKKLTGASQRRAYSPMPHPQNLFQPPSQAPREQFTAALVQKTCQILLGPPADLVALMLRIAARISNGVFSFNTYRVHEETERIPCSWESSSGDDDEWAEDDFGIPLGHVEPSGLRRRDPVHGSWELD